MKKSYNGNSGKTKISALQLIVISCICTVLLIMTLFIGVALASESTTSKDSDAQTLIHAATGHKDLKWSHVFGGQPGKDLYFMIYKQILVDPDREVEKESAAQNGMTEKELQSVLRGDISPILAQSPGLSIGSAFEKLEKLRSQHNERLAITTLKKDLESEVLPSEMFSNGDTSDSGFDLLADLYRIEKILFDKSVPVDVGGNQLGQGSGIPGRMPIKNSDNDSSNGSGKQNDSKLKSSLSNKSKNSPRKPNKSIDPEICLIGDNLDKALKKLDLDSDKDPRLRNQPPNGIKSNESKASDVEDDKNNDSDNVTKAPPPSKWENPEFCGDVFCIEVDAKFKVMKAIPQKANCVSCHIKAINKSIKKLLSKSLLPGKVTGNLGEPAKCKAAVADAFTSINMNVIVIGAPVKDPGNNDLVVGKPISEQWQKFSDRFSPGSGKKTAAKQAEDFKKPSVTLQDQIANKISSDAPADANAGDLMKQINKTLTDLEDARKKSLTDFITAGKIDNATSHFQALRYQLATMNSYFSSYKKLFTEIEASCKTISSKKECK